ncbi:MAG TPA: cytochrome P450, partial [Ktedonobacterales bacterium]|nr:cytochrome P450 [Ktedonobacterales bacterium]
ISGLPTIETPPNYPFIMPAFLARMAVEKGPIFRRDLGNGQSLVYLIGPEANKLIMQAGRESFSHDLGWTPIVGEFFGKGLLNMDDPLHAEHRKMMNPAFAIAYMARYLPVMRRVIASRTREWAERGEVDVYQEARKITFDVAAETLVGFPAGEEVDTLRGLFYTMLAGDFDPTGESEETFWQRMLATGMDLSQRLLAMIERRRNAPAQEERDDILTMLVRARDAHGEPLSDEQILGHVNILLVAGHETSTTLATWLLYELASHPAYLARVHAELDRVLGDRDDAITLDQIKDLRELGYALSETGRLHPPAGNVPRGVVKDVEFNGYLLPAGTRVIYSIAASHRLPHIFARPDEFDPDRFAPPREEDKKVPYSLVTFGGGPRICIGINFAQVEIKALAAHVLRRYTLEPVGGAVEMGYWGPTGTLPQGMPMRVRARNLASR